MQLSFLREFLSKLGQTLCLLMVAVTGSATSICHLNHNTMTHQRKTLGDQGEAAACAYLQAKGYEILATQWRFSRAEIDIIARQGDRVVFVEVKTRSDNAYSHPADAVTHRKMQLITDAAGQYLHHIQHEGEYRFDILAVLYKGQRFYFEHLEDAFWL